MNPIRADLLDHRLDQIGQPVEALFVADIAEVGDAEGPASRERLRKRPPERDGQDAELQAREPLVFLGQPVGIGIESKPVVEGKTGHN